VASHDQQPAAPVHDLHRLDWGTVLRNPWLAWATVSNPGQALPALVWRRPMVARRADEELRSATPLELFFDLCFVVAVAQAAAGLHHAVSEGHLADGVLGYVLAFFAVWWGG
jgi:hypothetical protein